MLQSRAALLGKIATAKQDIGTASRALERLIQEIDVAERAEKRTVSAAVETAFANLRAALANLAALEEMLEAADAG
jgi:hypothetical protein